MTLFRAGLSERPEGFLGGAFYPLAYISTACVSACNIDS